MDKARLRAEEIPCHALDGGDIDKGVGRIGIGQVFIRQHLWIERFIVAEVLLLEFLAVNFVFLGELVALWRIKGIERADGLSGERLAVHQKKDAAELLALQQPVNLRDGEKSFARAGGHGDEQFPQTGEHGAFRGDDGPNLIWTQPMIFSAGVSSNHLAGRFGIKGESFFHRRCRVKILKLTGDGLSVRDVQMPDDFAVGGIKKRNAIAIPIARTVFSTPRVAFGLFEDVLRIDRDLLGFNNAEKKAIDEKSIVRRTVVGGNFGDCVACEF